MRVGGSVRLATLAGLLAALGTVSVLAEQPYQGVTPAGAVEPSRLPGRPGQAFVGWPGFQPRDDGGALVFAVFGVEPSWTLDAQGNELKVRLQGVKLPPGNTRRPLDARFFETVVSRVHLTRARGGATLHVSLRAPVQPAVTVQRSDSGYYLMLLTFPPAPAPGDADVTADPAAD